jgi:twitching motility protein PilT
LIGAAGVLDLIERGRSRNASDLHVEPGQGAAYRIFTHVERIPATHVEPGDVEAFLDLAIDRVSRARLDKLGVADSMYADDRIGSIRIHASRGKLGSRLAIRLLARSIPDIDELELPPIIASFAEFRSGLVIVGGPVGSGKSTTIAGILDRINATTAQHIIILEDPVEHTHRWLRSIVTVYEVGRDVSTFAEGVRGALRADPDVLFVGELRDADTVSAALQAAETGHLVFAALHSPSESSHAVNRIIGLFPSEEQEHARIRLADTLRAVVGLRLIPKRDRTGVRAAAEVMVANDAVRRLIRDGATHQLRTTIAQSRKDGSQTLEAHLTELVQRGDIEISSARAASQYPDEVRPAMNAESRLR